MKKLVLLALGACLFATTTNTQAQNLKQSGGEKNFQVLFAPLSGTPISIGGISFRKFNATGDAAWRVNLFIGYSSKEDILEQAGDTNSFAMTGNDPTSISSGPHNDPNDFFKFGLNPEAVKTTKTLNFSIRPGYEKHFAGTERLSPYIGAELMFSMTSVTTETDSIGISDVTTDINTSYPVSAPYVIHTLETKGKGSSTTFGVNLLGGVDYYIAKNLSLGAEFGFGFSMTTMPDVESQYVKNTVTTSQTTPFTSTSTSTITDAAAQKQGKSMQIGPNAVGQLKLGWLF